MQWSRTHCPWVQRRYPWAPAYWQPTTQTITNELSEHAAILDDHSKWKMHSMPQCHTCYVYIAMRDFHPGKGFPVSMPVMHSKEHSRCTCTCREDSRASACTMGFLDVEARCSSQPSLRGKRNNNHMPRWYFGTALFLHSRADAHLNGRPHLGGGGLCNRLLGGERGDRGPPL